MSALPSFDELVDLAKENPEAFNILKQDICEEAIMSASVAMQDRLWAQQSYIDRLVGSCKNPVHSNIKLMQELAKQMHKFQSALSQKPGDHIQNNAEIIPFRSHR
ncbi:DUF3135 domain-containing protein [Vibrio sp.]|uniref:DUF3135 domain-containing protein n=1 Tax=Vibrio viridaestus TaxID=2487322 RepID=A0A3N9TWL6_9VIBR|nr:DUF3135 domain-containing protein [Vibrio viridaestus]MDC0610092.1 DUF3135 domain-containing protein [Vibrio sp.]RQW61312.1 DUF3135 domain-containing protein [Vibrio viridaestus]